MPPPPFLNNNNPSFDPKSFEINELYESFLGEKGSFGSSSQPDGWTNHLEDTGHEERARQFEGLYILFRGRGRRV